MRFPLIAAALIALGPTAAAAERIGSPWGCPTCDFGNGVELNGFQWNGFKFNGYRWNAQKFNAASLQGHTAAAPAHLRLPRPVTGRLEARDGQLVLVQD
jgi:hypothetical protein